MKGAFTVRLSGELKTYKEYSDIPDQFDHLIAFDPDYPPSPHSQEDHELIESINKRFNCLLERENASSN